MRIGRKEASRRGKIILRWEREWFGCRLEIIILLTKFILITAMMTIITKLTTHGGEQEREDHIETWKLSQCKQC